MILIAKNMANQSKLAKGFPKRLHYFVFLANPDQRTIIPIRERKNHRH